MYKDDTQIKNLGISLIKPEQLLELLNNTLLNSSIYAKDLGIYNSTVKSPLEKALIYFNLANFLRSFLVKTFLDVTVQKTYLDFTIDECSKNNVLLTICFYSVNI